MRLFNLCTSFRRILVGAPIEKTEKTEGSNLYPRHNSRKRAKNMGFNEDNAPVDETNHHSTHRPSHAHAETAHADLGTHHRLASRLRSGELVSLCPQLPASLTSLNARSLAA